MPVIKGISTKYRFFFYSRENDEPIHVHVQKDDAAAKFWIDGALASNKGFTAKELNDIEKLVKEHRSKIEEAWHEHFGK